MMPHSGSLSLSLSAIGILILALLYRDCKIDQVRDDIFAIRDEMFIFAAENHILDHPSYMQLRELMNAIIRFAHKITFMRIILWSVAQRFISEEERRAIILRWSENLGGLPNEQREALTNFHSQMHITVMVFAVESSIIATVGIRIPFLFSRIKNILQDRLLRRSESGW